MTSHFRFLNLLIVTILLFTYGCSDDDDNGANDGSDFNRQAILQNTANNIIVPNYQTLLDRTATLKQKVNDFSSSPSANTLDQAQQAFKDAYIAWQHCSAFEFGPGMEEVLRKSLNTYPTSDSIVEQNIATGNYDLSGLFTNDEKGFPAIDYLLYGKSDDAAVIDSFTNGVYASNRKTYLKDVTNNVNSSVQTVLNGWKASGGNYIETFINNTGTEAGSSISFLVNQLNQDWEIIKNPEIGIPAGEKSLGNPLPDKVQALYSSFSIDLSLEHAKALENLYLGRSRSGSDGKGLDEYLQDIGAQRNDQPLAQTIREQFKTAQQKISAIPPPLSDAVVNNQNKVQEAFDAIKKNVVFMKTDMTSAMGVQITYADNDGD